MNHHVQKMIGRKFGSLRVVQHHSRTTGYLCLCDCGKTTIARTDALKKGRHRSCGCAPRTLKRGHEPAHNEVYKNYRQAAKRRGYSFDLTKEAFAKLIQLNCYYCAYPPVLKSPLKRHEDFRYNGLDRIDNRTGYTLDNVVPCCVVCNNAKSTLTLSEWEAWIKRVYFNRIHERS